MIPSEDQEQQTFVQWLDLIGLRYTSIPNSTYTTSWKQKNHNHRLGLRKGFPDLVVLVPPEKSKDGLGHFIAIEMKRKKLSKTSPEQHEWFEAINDLGSPSVEAHICLGAEEAMWAVNQYVHPATNISPF